MTSQQIRAIIMSMSTKSCDFLRKWKTAIVRPFLKKINLQLINKNYRLVNNLSFMSKVVEVYVIAVP